MLDSPFLLGHGSRCIGQCFSLSGSNNLIRHQGRKVKPIAFAFRLNSPSLHPLKGERKAYGASLKGLASVAISRDMGEISEGEF